MIFKEIDPKKLNINKHELSARMYAPCDIEDGIFAKLYAELLLIAKPAYVAGRVELIEQNGGQTSISSAAVFSRSEARTSYGK